MPDRKRGRERDRDPAGVGLVLQARMGSSRYPGKSLTDIAGATLLDRVMARLESLFSGLKILAIPDHARDDVLVSPAESRGWLVFRGSESDVLGRYAGAVRQYGLRAAIRATADNPLTHPEALAGVAEALADGCDCVGTSGFPPGASVEGASASALLKAADDTTDPYDHEHVMPYLYKHPELFRTHFVAAPSFRFMPRVTVDTVEDIEQMRRLFAALGDNPDFDAAAKFLSENA